MKKLKLTQQEEELVKELQEVTRQLEIISKKKDKLNAEFWYVLTQRVPGNYTADLIKGEIWELSMQEVEARNNRRNN